MDWDPISNCTPVIWKVDPFVVKYAPCWPAVNPAVYALWKLIQLPTAPLVLLDPAPQQIPILNPLAVSFALNPVEVSAGIVISTNFQVFATISSFVLKILESLVKATPTLPERLPFAQKLNVTVFPLALP